MRMTNEINAFIVIYTKSETSNASPMNSKRNEGKEKNKSLPYLLCIFRETSNSYNRRRKNVPKFCVPL